ncbi:hypothetical protein [Qipengyuania zhejiangensis]|uniref:hypothetical protein n=1 Tax=Qipengyuania zhejiangensis TaxID=3077782 RepID=UPI002D79C465|nr:hypothetical protein [Qipengyuania sp. Z2]
MIRKFIFVTALGIGLGACGSDPTPQDADNGERAARGEVLGGTISDQMIPLDTLQSRSAPLRQESSGAQDAAPDAASPDETGTPTTDEAPEAEVAAPAEDAEG